MNPLSRFSPWVGRMVLVIATLIFTIIGVKNLVDPVGSTAQFKIVLGSPTAITNTRIGFGAFPLGFAILLLTCLLSRTRIVAGLYLIVIVIGLATVVRIAGIVVDGMTPETLKVLRPEVVLLLLASVSLFGEVRRQRPLAAGQTA